MIKLAKVSLTASDVTGQKNVAVRDVSVEYSIGEVIDGLLPQMQLNRLDRAGHPVNYDVRLDREGRTCTEVSWWATRYNRTTTSSCTRASWRAANL